METLQSLAQQVERQRQLAVLLQSLKQQISEVQRKVDGLKTDWQSEEADVEKLKKTGLTAIFYEIIGKKEEKLEKEQREALTAAATAALALYDMCKAVQKDMMITDIRLVSKTGGVHGDYYREGEI